jgi:hypothetical protein
VHPTYFAVVGRVADTVLGVGRVADTVLGVVVDTVLGVVADTVLGVVVDTGAVGTAVVVDYDVFLGNSFSFVF